MRSAILAVTLAALFAAAAMGCVGEQSGQQPGERLEDEEFGGPFPADYGSPRATRDTAQPVGYQVFEVRVKSEEPRKVEYRLMVTEPAGQAALHKTLRTVLDSIGRADSSLVAARGILYLIRSTGRRRATLLPWLWGEWVPPAGWDSASAESRQDPYRVYTYDQNPGWRGLGSGPD